MSITHGILVERHGQVMAEGALETHLSFLKSLGMKAKCVSVLNFGLNVFTFL